MIHWVSSLTKMNSYVYIMRKSDKTIYFLNNDMQQTSKTMTKVFSEKKIEFL